MQKHLRNTFLAGIFAAVPVGVTIFLVWYVENATRQLLVRAVGIDMRFIGIPIAILAVYFLGLIVTSLIGRFFLRVIDRVLLRLPFLKDVYQAWKHIALTPGGKEGMYAKVVLIPGESGETRLMGFTTGDPVPGDDRTCCVFVPNSPNPVMGRLYFVPRERCLPIDITAEEAFKLILSSGNYIPAEVGAMTATCRS
jgi:uncharacterized membrane protein